MRRRWVLAPLGGVAVVALIWAVAAAGSSPSSTTTTAATATASTTTEGVVAPTAAPDTATSAPPTTAAAVRTSTPAATVTTTTAATSAAPDDGQEPVEVTTTTIPSPIDERLPRTAAAATETDPVPIGQVVAAQPGVWDIALTQVELDATATVLAYAEINPEPPAGYQDVLVTVEGTYLGHNLAQPVFEWAILADGNEYRPSVPGCGVIPDSLYDVEEVLPGESFTAHVCMPVASEDVAAGIQLYLNAPGDQPRYFSLG